MFNHNGPVHSGPFLNKKFSMETVQPTVLRKYIYEYSLIALAGCVVFLFLALNDLNKFIRQNLIEQKAEVVRTVEKNTAIIENFIRQQNQPHK